GEYMNTYIENNGGYLENPTESVQCKYCPYTMQEQVVTQYGIHWNQHWRNFGIAWIYIIFNFFAMCGGYYLFRVRGFSISGLFNVKKWFEKARVDRHEKDTTIFAPQAGDDKVLVPKKEKN
ncbi:hypothetical protein CANINC_004814, partial [Pichia inconspicua]